jgi:hypothetical protein
MPAFAVHLRISHKPEAVDGRMRGHDGGGTLSPRAGLA